MKQQKRKELDFITWIYLARTKDAIITYNDVVPDENRFTYPLRKNMEKEYHFAGH